MDQVQFDTLILTGMPSFIARNYQALLETSSASERIKLITRIYDLWLRMLTITLVSQYLVHNRETFSDDALNKLLEEDFDFLPIDGWQKAFFKAMEAYKGQSKLFFMPELYDFYWDTKDLPHTPRAEVQVPFKRLTEISAQLTQPENVRALEAGGWEELAEELEEHLRSILEATKFYTDYDLVRVLEVDQGSATLELFKGTRLVTTHEALSGHGPLFPDRFYLRARTNDFLSLHPLLISWINESTQSESLPPEVAVYYRYFSEQLQYILSLSSATLPVQQYAKEFIQLIYTTLEQIKKKHRQAKQLTWDELGRISAEITEHRMKTAQEKYDEKLYLQREHTLDELLKFLFESDKRCFVLIGRSGVGKSNFLLSFNQFLRQTRGDDVRMLMYDGALLHFETALDEIIKQDFENRLIVSDKKIEDIWKEIAKIPQMDKPNRRVILCVDAINESAHAIALLRQLDDLVQRTSWPWLRVIFSSRPETWQSIRRGVVNLDVAKYYRAAGSDSLENRLEPFNYSEQMESFTSQELPEAYAKYQAKFDLKTAFADIPFAVREVLREPFNLWIVAEANEHKAIPNRVSVTELVKDYVHALIESGRLTEEDERLLRERLIPLMVNFEHYDNKITQKEIYAAGGGLYEAIYSDAINRPFVRLVDFSILAHQKTGNAQRVERAIAFKYERFYEYFIGERLAELSTGQSNRAGFFLNLVDQTGDKPFLWGAIRNALYQMLAQGDMQTIDALCHSNHLRVKELMIDALSSYGADHPARVLGLLRELIPIEKTSSLQQLRQFMGRSGKAPDTGVRNASKIAVEVASTLGFTELLQRAGVRSDPTIRAATVRFGYLLWERDRRAGFSLLDYLGKEAIRSFIPNMAAFESALGLSLLIFFDHPNDKEVLQHLPQLWHTVIGRILAIKESSNRISKVFRTFVRERVFSLAIGLAVRLLKDLPPNLPIQWEGFETFFRRNAAEKALYRRLTRYMRMDGTSTSYEEMKQDFLAALPIMDGVIQPVSCMGLSVHLARNPAAALPLMKELFDAAEHAPPPNLWLTGVGFALTPILDADPSNDEVFDCFVEMMERCQRYYAQPGHSAGWIDSECPEAIFLGQYIYYQYKRLTEATTDFLKARIKTELEQKHERFFRLLVTIHLPLVVFEMGAPQPVLDTLALFFNERDQIVQNEDEEQRRKQIDEIEGYLSTLLGQMRGRYPDAVDSFLDAQHAPAEFRLRVLTSETPETVGDMIGLRLFRVAFSLLISDQPIIRDKLILLFEKAADCKNTRALIDYLIREVINLIYQGEALRQAK